MHLCSLSAVSLCNKFHTSGISCWTRAHSPLTTAHHKHCTSTKLHFVFTSVYLSCTRVSIRRYSSRPQTTRIPFLTIAPLRSTTPHRLRHGSGAGKGPDTRMGRPGPLSGTFCGGRTDFSHSVTKERSNTIGPKVLQQFPKSSPQTETGVELLKSNVVQLDDGARQLLKLIRLRLGKDLQPSPNTISAFFTAQHVCSCSR